MQQSQIKWWIALRNATIANQKTNCPTTRNNRKQKKKRKRKKMRLSSYDTQWSCHQKTNCPVTHRCINHPMTCNDHAIKRRIVLRNTTITTTTKMNRLSSDTQWSCHQKMIAQRHVAITKKKKKKKMHWLSSNTQRSCHLKMIAQHVTRWS